MKKKLNISKHQNFLATILVIHFGFFGYICYLYPNDIGTRLLFFNFLSLNINPQSLTFIFNEQNFFSLIILVIIVFIYGLSERFFEYGIRNSLWLVPILVIESWIWYFIIGIYHVNVYEVLGNYFNYFYFPYNFGIYFLVIFMLFLIIFIVAFNAAFIRQRYDARLSIKKKIRE